MKNLNLIRKGDVSTYIMEVVDHSESPKVKELFVVVHEPTGTVVAEKLLEVAVNPSYSET